MKQLVILFFLFSLSLQAQFQINGIIKDSESKNALPFANISTEKGFSTIADVDGKFSFFLTSQPETLIISYVGYTPKTIPFYEVKPFLTVYLFPEIDNLKEIVIPSENPANAIIAKVIQHKEANNPQKRLTTFQFKAYNKLLVTANPDSITSKIDTVFVNSITKEKIKKIDSSDYKFKKMIDKQHLFITEKVSLFQFEKPILKETVLGTKMAGLKEPIYELLGISFQSFSIYDDSYELFETKYKSPISNRALKEYRYKILDTTSIDNREVIVLHFKDKISTKGLEGLLYVDRENYAVAKAVMRIRAVLDVTGIHEFTYLPKENLWFPIRKSSKIVKGKSKEPTTILGRTIEFEAENDKEKPTDKKAASDFTYLSLNENIFDLQVNNPVKIRKTGIAIDVKENANIRDDDFWKQNRSDSLDIRSERTYEVLDSIVKKEKFEKKIRFGRKIINGYYPLGPFDFDLRYLLNFNNYEGFRIGVGGITNELFSRKYRIEGYSAYGLKDEVIKYNLGFSFRAGESSNSWIGASYTDDISEIASSNFATDKRIYKFFDPRSINLSTFYNHKTCRAYIETEIFPKTESIWQISHSDINPLFNYTFNYNGNSYHTFSTTTASVSIQWSPYSDFMQTPSGKIEFAKRYPKFTFQFTKSLPGILGNDFNYGKIDARIDYEKQYLNGHKSAVTIQSGYAFGAIPLTHLYSTSPNNLNKDNLFERITFAGKNSFETMYYNEFFSSEFVMVHLKHSFKKMEISHALKPTLVMVTRMAWGNFRNPEQHSGIEFKTLDKGYFESGIELNKIYRGFGFSGFYRYGPNQLSRVEDNIAIKISFVLDLGF